MLPLALAKSIDLVRCANLMADKNYDDAIAMNHIIH